MSSRTWMLVAATAVLWTAADLAGRPIAAPQAPRADAIDAESVRAAGALDRLLPPLAETTYRALTTRFTAARAMDVVTFMDRFWRLPGNPGFDASIDRLRSELLAAGFTEGAGTPGASLVRVEEYPNGGNGWDPRRAEMTIVGSDGEASERVFDPVTDHIALCINSFSTPPEGVVSRLVYVGRGTDAASYAGLDVAGAVVLGDGGMRGLWTQAVRQRGAVGVISAAPPEPFTRPDETPEVFQWGSVPYDDTKRAFGFNASRRVADRLKARLRAGAVRVKTVVDTRFTPGAAGRILVAEIPGRSAPAQRVVVVAHVQEPGANDNASGCATLLEMAKALQAAIAAHAIPAPARTLTFIWGDEMRVSSEWIKANASRAAGVRYMVSFDMTGEDVAKTGGSFLIEKEPDPSAAWDRPSDPHTPWGGGGSAYKGALRGSLLNDVVLAACLRRARDTTWNVQTNPYEGGSDHSVFLEAHVPSLLAWHFTDRYYHTNLDRADKTSPAEMANVGIAFGTATFLLAASGDSEAAAVVELVKTAGERRLALERKQGASATIVDAWTRWYGEALESALTLPATAAGGNLRERVRAAREALR